MQTYMIERDIPGVGAMNDNELCGAAATSNAALADLSPSIQWQHSYVAGEKTFCVYLAEDERAIHEHARKSGFPATKVTLISGRIDPTTGAGQNSNN